MMRLLIVVLLGFGFGIALLELVRGDPGYLLVSIYGKTLETSLWFAITVTLAVLALLWALFWVIRRLLRGTLRGGRWFVAKRAKGVEQRYREGLLHYLVGNWNEAARLLNTLRSKRQLPVVRTIVVAQSLAQQGDIDGACRRLVEAEANHAEDLRWLHLARFDILLAAKRCDEAEAILLALADDNVSREELDLREIRLRYQQRAWPALIDVAPKLEKFRDTLEPTDVYRNALLTFAEQEPKDPEAAQKLWHNLPKKLRQTPAMLEAYGRVLYASGLQQELAEFTEINLTRNWLPELVQLYGKIDQVDKHRRLQHAQRWHGRHGDKEELLFTLGILAYKNQLWGQARKYFEKLITSEDNSRALYALGLIAERLDDPAGSFDYFKRAAGINALKY